MAKRKLASKLDRELDRPIPWVSALVIAVMALVMFAGVAFGADDVSIATQRERLELGRQYLIADFAASVSLGTVTQDSTTKTAQEIMQIDLAILQSYLVEGELKTDVE